MGMNTDRADIKLRDVVPILSSRNVVSTVSTPAAYEDDTLHEKVGSSWLLGLTVSDHNICCYCYLQALELTKCCYILLNTFV